MEPKRIAVNTRFLIHGKLEGIGWFTYETLKRIVKKHPEYQFHFLFDRAYHPSFLFADNVVPHVVLPQARHPVLWKWWFDLSVPITLSRINPDVFVSPDGFLSLKTSVPSLLVIHDIAFEHFADHVNRLAQNYYRKNTPLFVKKADRIATVSEFSKQDIINHYRVAQDKIDIIYNGASEIYEPLSEQEIKLIRRQATGGLPYLIYAGSIHPRKNVKNLLLAFDAFKAKTGSLIKLIIAGRQAWQFQDIIDIHNKMDHRVDVIFKGHLNQNDLSRLVGASVAMIYVSLFEGFGIPLIEAMQCNVPVITSNTSSMIEVGGEAALSVSPTSVDSIAEGIETMTGNEQLRKKLIEKGKVQCKKFSWDNTADLLWESILKVMGTSH